MTNLCSNCASELPKGAQTFASCGEAQPTPAQPVAESALAPLPQEITPPSFAMTEDLQGISGWLILVAIGLVVAPFVMLYTVVTVNIPFLYQAKHQTFLANHPALAALLLFEVVSNTVFILCVAALNYLFFTRRKGFPAYFILYMAVHFLVLLIDTLVAHALAPTAKLDSSFASLARTLVSGLVWIPYMLVSRRVKLTFVR